MATGKYGMKIPTNNGYYGYQYNPRLSAGFNIGAAIGSAIGDAFADNYNQRGIRKGEDEARAVIDKYMNGVMNNGPASANTDDTTTQWQDVSEKFGIPKSNAPIPKSNDTNTYVDKTKNYAPTNGKTLKDMKPERDLKAERQDYVFRKYNSGTPNPDGDATTVNVLTEAAKGNLANMDFSKLPRVNMDEMQSAIRKELRAKGRTDYQIEQVLKNLEPNLKAKLAEGNNYTFGQMYNIMNQQIKAGELDAANMTFAEMSKLDKEKAAALAPKMKRAWDSVVLEQNFQNKYNFYKQDKNLTDQQAWNMARYGSIYNPAEQAHFFGTKGTGKATAARDGGTSVGGSTKTRSTNNTNVSNAKISDWKAKKEWADEILANPNASKSDKDSAVRTIKDYNKFMAGNNYVVPMEDVYSQIEKALYNGEISPQEAYDWVWGDSGLGDAEKRELAIWLNQNYRDFNGDYIGEDTRDAFFGPDKVAKTETSSRPSNKPLMQNGTFGQWLSEMGQTWDKAKEEAKRRKAAK